uniref:Uncharacterized protein n=1 Tax=Caenorhabditis japonica TaxID=281687 RepID=A0A8R1I7M1_CAEJA
MAKARFILTKLDKREEEQFRNHILPKTPAEVDFEDTIQMMNKFFNKTKSLTRIRYELLSVKFDGYGRKEYIGHVKSRFSAQWTKMTEDQAQCLLWSIGLQSNEHLNFMHFESWKSTRASSYRNWKIAWTKSLLFATMRTSLEDPQQSFTRHQTCKTTSTFSHSCSIFHFHGKIQV